MRSSSTTFSSRTPSYLHKRPNSPIFYFRISIPLEFRALFGISEFRRSLHTPYRRDARLLASHIHVHFENVFTLLQKYRNRRMSELTESEFQTLKKEFIDLVTTAGLLTLTKR